VTETELESDLATELAWVRRLARVIARDSALADDLAQEAMAVADRAPADHRMKWFGRVLRNLLRMRRRGAERRARYESVADGGVVATPEELVARTEAQRAVSGAVLALAEPYRSTVVLRYVEDLPSAEIARRLGIPEGTVRRRLKVALDRLRAELDRDGDGSRRFALLLLGRRRAPVAPVMAVAAMVVLAGVIAIATAVGGSHATHVRASAFPRSAATSSVVSTSPEAAPPQLPGLPPPHPSIPCKMLSGHVRDAVGSVAGARVSSGGELVTTDEVGHYELCIHPIHAVVRVDAPGYGAIEDGRIHPTEALEHDFELVPEAPIHGHVVDASGHALSGARVVARADRNEPAAAPGAAVTRADGSFMIAGLEPGRYEVVASTTDRSGYALVAANASERSVEIVVDQVTASSAPATVTGIVTRHGRGLAGAEVWCLTMANVATTSGDGSFVLADLPSGRCALVAMTATAVSKVVPLDLVAGEVRRNDLEAASAGSIAGTVVDLTGAAVRGVFVSASGADGIPAGDTISDARGAFVITTLPAGHYTLSVYPSPALGAPFPTTPVAVALADNDAAVDGVQLAIDNRRTEIHGRVVDHAGASISDAYVEASHGDDGQFPAATRTTLDGSFAIRNLVAGSYVIRARTGDGRRVEQDEVVAGRGEVVLVLAH
jgi:RNA polymerase sigma-70 factor (ECF subfamily)